MWHCRHLHQELFRKEVHLPPFPVEGEFIRVIRLLSVFSLRGGGFPLGFPSFPHLDLFLSIFWVSLLYRVTYGLSYWGPSISYILCFYSTEYSYGGGVGDIYPPCTLNLVNLTFLNHYPKFYWLNRHQMSTLGHHHEHTHTYLQSRRPNKPSPSFKEAN